MILPLIIPDPNKPDEILNLAQLISWNQSGDPATDAYVVICTFAGGITSTYRGNAARVVRDEMVFAFNLYRQFRHGIETAGQQSSLIVPPDFNGRVN